MLRKIRKLIPHSIINYGKHLPEAVLANYKNNFPSKGLKIIGVTGTDGKTTTVNMIYKVLKDAGFKVSMLSTINAVIGGKSYDTGFHVTSPRAKDVQKYLKMAKDHGDQFMVLEVTSHALDQFRFWGIKFDIAVITNITHEHLDYHKSFENYRAAKAKLIKGAKWTVLNCDDPNYSWLKKQTSGKVMSFGLNKSADLSPDNFSLKLKLPGEYNVLNGLAAALVGILIGVSHKQIRLSLEGLDNLDGRMEEIKSDKGVKIFVDFAHTPNALENALKTLRGQTKGKLISVFGCASERDVEKRPAMGKISSDIADVTVLTDEDPRFEDSIKIIDQIKKGGDFIEGKNLFIEANREKAIKLAISLAKKGDTVGIFGKGHESSMNYKGKELPWSDKKAVLKIIKNG